MGVDTEGMDLIIVSEFFAIDNFRPWIVVWENKNEGWAMKEDFKSNPKGYTSDGLRELIVSKGYDVLEGGSSANSIAILKGYPHQLKVK